MYTQKVTTLSLGGSREATGRFLAALVRNVDRGDKTPEQAALQDAVNNVSTTDSSATLAIAHPQSLVLATRLADMARKQGLTAATTGPMEFYQAQVMATPDASRPTPFLCLAESTGHARRQAEEMYPGCTILSATPLSEAMEAKAHGARLWLATVGHEEAIGTPDVHLFWQVSKPTEAEVLARYGDLFAGEPTGLEVEAVLDVSRALEFAPENAEALEACQTHLHHKEGEPVYVITGRLPPDEETVTRVIQASTEEIARLAFEVDLYLEREGTISREAVIAEWGVSVVFSQVFQLTPDAVTQAAPEAQLRTAFDHPAKAAGPAPSP